MSDLHLNLKAKYFNEIKNLTKKEEYRIYNDYWKKRLHGKTFDRILIKNGYPNKSDMKNQIERPFKGFTVKTITHPHFGKKAVKVFAIIVN